ncbi:Phosphatidylinositol-3-phosphate5- kinase (Fab-like, PIPK-A1) [Achlya hypogyna]|uniref:1-phosphatidylinositol-3-phosphate 5-kinase n=1 Tax=Achlya hypogyna TaxID=1202772 RepID=A0A1V9ZDC2_ACHHY|nr:Phosphatidylinositol-3-phosphate5- kinase (Fab-like, PIPK-A1) [Achlya hypogyna]
MKRETAGLWYFTQAVAGGPMLCGLVGHCFPRDLPSPSGPEAKRPLRPGLSISHFDLPVEDPCALTTDADEKVIVELRVDTRGGPMDFGLIFRRSAHPSYAVQVDSVHPRSAAKDAGVVPGALLTDIALQSVKYVLYDDVLQLLMQCSNHQALGSTLHLVFSQRAKTIHLDRSVDQLTTFPQPTGLALPGTNDFVVDTKSTASAPAPAAPVLVADELDAMEEAAHNTSHTRFWMSDQHVKSCYSCDEPFTFCRRKHHCRSCGQIFCYQCVTRLPASFKPTHDSAEYLRKQLVCHPCHRHLRDGHHSDTAAAKPPSGVYTKRLSATALPKAALPSSSPPTVLSARPVDSVGSLVDDTPSIGLEKAKVDLQLFSMFPRVQLAPAAAPAIAPVTGPHADTDVQVPPLRRRAVSEPSLSAVVRKKSAAILATTTFAPRPRSNSRDDLYTYRQPTNVVRSTRSATELMVEALMLSGDRTDGGVATSLAPPMTTPALLPHTSSSASLLKVAPIHLGHACLNASDVPGLADAVRATTAEMASDGDQWLHERVLALWEASPVLTQLPYLEQSRFVDQIFAFATRAAATIDVGDALDILQYLRIKCFPGGHVADSFFVHGVLCHKSVARKSMRQWIEAPRLLLIGAALDYQREKEKLSSLESVAGQETEYMRIAVEKIRTLRPDIVLFQGHVHRVAEELLATSGIVVVKNLKRADLQRLARVTHGALLTSYDHIDKLFGQSVLGTCDRFRVWSSEGPKAEVPPEETPPAHLATTHVTTAVRGARHLTPPLRAARKRVKKQSIVFEGGEFAKGCTIALRGAAENVLKEVRHVLRAAARTAYHLRLQRTVLATIGLRPPMEAPDFRHEWFHASSSLYLALNDHSLSARAALKESQLRCRQCKRATGRRGSLSTGMDNLVSRRRRSSESGRKPPVSAACRCAPDVHRATREALVVSACWSRLDDHSPSPAELLEIVFYSDADLTLGQFLARYCFESAGAAFKTAFRTQRLSFSHDLGRVVVAVTPAPKGKPRGPGQELLDMFNFASRVVASETPLLWVATEAAPALVYAAMPPEMAHYSFGKFLEDLLYLQPLPFDSRFFPELSHARDPSLLRYFACADVVVCISVEPIQPVLHVAMRPALWDVDRRPTIEQIDVEELVIAANEVLDVTLAKVQVTLDDFACIGEKMHVNLPKAVQEIEKVALMARHWHIMFTQQVRSHPPTDVFAKNAVFRKVYEKATSFCVELRDTSSRQMTFRQTEAIDEPPPTTLPLHWYNVLSQAAEASPPPASSVFGTLLLSPQSVFSMAKPPPSPPVDIAHRAVDSAAGQRDFVSRVRNGEIERGASYGLEALGHGVAYPDSFTEFLELEGSHGSSSVSSQSHSLNRTQVVGSNAVVRKPSADQSHLFVLPKGILSWHPSLPRGVGQTVVLVNSSQPTSAVAYSLCSKEYTHQLYDWFAKQDIPVFLGAEPANVPGMLAALRSDRRSNVDHLFVDENEFQPATKFSCKSYYATQFYALRQLLYKDERKYVESLCQCEQWNASGGKSGAGFMRTKDQRFICKVIPAGQLNMFLNMASSYFEYMARTFDENLPTMLGKIVGVYRISITETAESTLCLLVMENLVYGRQVDHLFDLKGKLEGRFMEHTDHQVLWDRNFVKMTKGIPLPLQESAMSVLKAAILHDTAFLSSQDVTDYSMLVGYDHEKQEVVAGIIDYIVKYDFLKRLEHHGKRLLQDEGEITVLNPKQYTKRFRTAMTKYFTAVPSRYTLVVAADSSDD